MKKFTLGVLFGSLFMAGTVNAQLSGYQTEGFEGTTFPPAGWQSTSISGTNQWSRSTVNSHTGSASAFMSYQSTGGEDWLITPQYSVTATTDSLIFWMLLDFSGYAPDSLAIKVSTTDAATTSFTSTLLLLQEGVNYPGDATNWYRYGVSLAAYNGQDIYIAFKHVDNDGDGLFIDDVALGTQPAAEVMPLSIDMPTAGGTSTIPVQVTVHNSGTAPQTFDVTTTITPGSYSSTQTVTGLAPGASTAVTFAPFTPVTAGSYTITTVTQLAGDANMTNDTLTQSIAIYDSFENYGWTTNSLPSGRWATAPVFVKRCVSGADTGYVYLISGADASFANTASNDRYNMVTGTWENMASIPASRTQITPLYANNKIYVMGGYGGSFSPVTTNSIYDIATNTWNTGAAMPTAVGDYACGIYNDSLIYIIGGYNGSGDVNTVQIYNVNTDTWTTGTAKTGTAVAGGRAAISGNTIVFSGGYSQTLGASISDALTGTIDLSDPTLITWNPIDNYPGGTVGRHAAGVPADDNGKVYFAGGDPNGGGVDVLSTVYAYNVSGSTWETGPDMPTGVSNISGLAGVIRNDSLFLVTAGGYDGAGVVTSFDWLKLDARTLTNLSNTSTCYPGSVILAAYNGTAYSWTPATGLDNDSVAAPTASPDTTTTYTVSIDQKYGCPVTRTVTVYVSNISLNVTSDVTGSSCTGTVTVSATGGLGTYSYLWSPGGETTSTISGLCAGTYTAMVTDSLGCYDTISTTVQSTLNIASLSQEANLQVYPNPAREALTITANMGNGNMGGIALINALGEQVMLIENRTITGTYTKTIDISSLARGIYFVQFRNAQGLVTRKVVKN